MIKEPLPSTFSRFDRWLYRALQRRIPVGPITALLMSNLLYVTIRQLFHRLGFWMVLAVDIPAALFIGYFFADWIIEWRRTHHLGPCLNNSSCTGTCWRPGRWAVRISLTGEWSGETRAVGCWCDRHAPAVLAEWATQPGSEHLAELGLVPYVWPPRPPT